MFNLTQSPFPIESTNNSSSTVTFLSAAVDLFNYWLTGKNPNVTAQVHSLVESMKPAIEVNPWDHLNSEDTLTTHSPFFLLPKEESVPSENEVARRKLQVMVGTGFQINDNTLEYVSENPRIAGLTGGGFVVIWHDTYPRSSGYIRGKVYSATGAVSVPQFVVDNSGYRPAVAGLTGGGFVVVWQQSNNYIIGQLYSAAGVIARGEFLINTATFEGESPTVAGLTGGGFVVTWHRGTGGYILSQLYSAAGVAIGSTSQVYPDGGSSGLTVYPTVAALTSGGFVVTWTNVRPVPLINPETIHGQLYSATGAAVGSAFQINTDTLRVYAHKVAGLTSGGFVVTWSEDDPTNYIDNIIARLYSATGVAIGSEFQVNIDDSTSSNSGSQVAGLTGGGFVVIWYKDAFGNINGRLYSATGVAIGSQFQVNTDPFAASPNSVAGLTGGGFVVTWRGFVGKYNIEGQNIYNIYGQLFNSDVAPSPQPSSQPSRQPSRQPSTQPTSQPSLQPSRQPSRQPSTQPSTQPSRRPSGQPTRKPSAQPSRYFSRQPTRWPTGRPSAQPTMQPTDRPPLQPSGQPTGQPSSQPSVQPSRRLTARPSRQPSGQPSRQPSARPSRQLTRRPSSQPTRYPSGQPTRFPSASPTRNPTSQPSRQPNAKPSGQPSSQPMNQPSMQPTTQPSRRPSNQPTRRPSSQPSGQPSRQPSAQPSGQPSHQPTRQPTKRPSDRPTRQPTIQPSNQPTVTPTKQPNSQPSTKPSFRPTNATPTGSLGIIIGCVTGGICTLLIAIYIYHYSKETYECWNKKLFLKKKILPTNVVDTEQKITKSIIKQVDEPLTQANDLNVVNSLTSNTQAVIHFECALPSNNIIDEEDYDYEISSSSSEDLNGTDDVKCAARNEVKSNTAFNDTNNNHATEQLRLPENVSQPSFFSQKQSFGSSRFCVDHSESSTDASTLVTLRL